MLFSFLTACRSPETGTADSSAPTAIRLTGNVVGAMLLLDDRIAFQITGESGRMQLNVAPGKHHVRVEKNGGTVLDQTVSVKSGQIVELAVP